MIDRRYVSTRFNIAAFVPSDGSLLRTSLKQEVVIAVLNWEWFFP